MTYWPISSPSVFAATKNTNLERTPVSHDGTNEAAQSGRGGASDAGSTDAGDEDMSTEEPEELKEDEKKQEKSQTDALEQLVEDDVHGKIVAIPVTGSGQLFATLTRTTLTVWQTKVCLIRSCDWALLTFTLAYCHLSFGSTIAAVAQDLRSQHRRSTSPRFPDLRRADYARFSDHVLACNRPLVPRIQDTVHRYTWHTFKEK